MAHCPQSQAGSSPCWGPSALPKLLVPTNIALSGPSVGMGCFLSCNLSQQGDKCDRLLSKRKDVLKQKSAFRDPQRCKWGPGYCESVLELKGSN